MAALAVSVRKLEASILVNCRTVVWGILTDFPQAPSRFSPMFHSRFFRSMRLAALACAMFALSACNGTTVAIAGAATGIWYSRDRKPPPADTASQMAEHESWCYKTLAEPVCYAHPQEVPPSRLINVQPENKYPMSRGAYYQALAGNQ